MEKLRIIQAQRKNLEDLRGLMSLAGKSGDTRYFEEAFARQDQGRLKIFLAGFEGDSSGTFQICGYCLLNWSPKYALFKKLGIAEVQDLNVVQAHRRQGVGERLIRCCEEYVRDEGGAQIGIGVGLDGSFGAAQRLYVRLGYIPDGYGVTYDREFVPSGTIHPIDEQLSLMMVKELT